MLCPEFIDKFRKTNTTVFGIFNSSSSFREIDQFNPKLKSLIISKMTFIFVCKQYQVTKAERQLTYKINKKFQYRCNNPYNENTSQQESGYFFRKKLRSN